MDFMDCYSKTPAILMEGALGERLKREYGICFDETLGLAGLVYDHKGRTALTSIWNEYIGIADEYQMPLLLTTPTRRANRDRVSKSAYDGTIIGIQPNTSSLSPEELDGSAELVSSGADELAEAVLRLSDIIQLKLVGGCCGTDASHIRAIAGRIRAAGESQ